LDGENNLRLMILWSTSVITASPKSGNIKDHLKSLPKMHF